MNLTNAITAIINWGMNSMGEFLFERLSDPEYYEENRVAAHSDHVAYRNWDEADVWLDPLGRKSSFRLFLDGSWKFHYAKNYEQTIRGFEKPEYDCRGWDDIRVPAHIQMEGYDSPQYANTQYPWDGREDVWTDEMPTKFNPVASYVKYFTLPESFSGERVFISFQGAESGMALWLNGTYVGYSEDSFTPSEFELTPYLKDGENKLAVQVFKWTIGSWCEDQDFRWRRVCLVARWSWIFAPAAAEMCAYSLWSAEDLIWRRAAMRHRRARRCLLWRRRWTEPYMSRGKWRM